MAAEEFIDRIVVRPDGCWTLAGTRNRNGYMQVWVEGKRLLVHRFVWSILVGPIKNQLHHTCENKECVNIGHLEDVTQKEHSARHSGPRPWRRGLRHRRKS